MTERSVRGHPTTATSARHALRHRTVVERKDGKARNNNGNCMRMRQYTHLCIPEVCSKIVTLLAELEGYDFAHYACQSQAALS
jgi:hypothetical protein